MRSIRLSHALYTGAVVLPDTGSILVLRPRAGDDLSVLPRDRLRLVTGFRPDHDWFAAQGLACTRHPEGRHAAALVCLPRARDHARALIATAAAHVDPGGPVIIDGQKTDGVDAVQRDLRARGIALTAPESKAHGKIFSFAAGPDLSDWLAAPLRHADGTVTLPGVFSADGPDRGSALLAAALPGRLPPVMADLGAGWGFLSRAVLSRDGVAELHLIEAEADALDCARKNVTDPRARFHWADATRFHPERGFDGIVCNPPFHTAREADPGLGLAFIRAAAGLLTGAGVLWLVANRHLPYDRALADSFREVEDIGGDAAFRLIRAARPATHATPAPRPSRPAPTRGRQRRR